MEFVCCDSVQADLVYETRLRFHKRVEQNGNERCKALYDIVSLRIAVDVFIDQALYQRSITVFFTHDATKVTLLDRATTSAVMLYLEPSFANVFANPRWENLAAKACCQFVASINIKCCCCIPELAIILLSCGGLVYVSRYTILP